jgi:release factor glutamine methyltransferase
MAERLSVARALARAIEHLTPPVSESPRLDGEVLLAHVLHADRSWLYAHTDHLLSASQQSEFFAMVSRRASGEPVAYLVGHKEFFGLDFLVSPAVLVPRPETELLVETAIRLFGSFSGRLKVADVGTGSGAIAVSLAIFLPQARLLATDISPAALDVARRNALHHGVKTRIDFLLSDLLTPCVDGFSLVTANLPYLRQDELPGQPSSNTAGVRSPLAWEPGLALDGGIDGLSAIKRLLSTCASRLRPPVTLLLEIGAGQGAQALALAGTYLPKTSCRIIKDLAGMDRLLVVQ